VRRREYQNGAARGVAVDSGTRRYHRRVSDIVSLWLALTERLGTSDAIRLLMQYDGSRGDYTAERRQIFGQLTLDAALIEMKALYGKGPRLRRVRRRRY
jgi:hypothetical protein